MSEPISNLDPVTLTVIQNGLIQVCNEMDLAFVRSAFSPAVRLRLPGNPPPRMKARESSSATVA